MLLEIALDQANAKALTRLAVPGFGKLSRGRSRPCRIEMAFEGRQAPATLQGDGGTVSLEIITGNLTDGTPICRIRLNGPDAAVETVALVMAETLCASLPDGPLGAEVLPRERPGPPTLPHDPTLPIAEAFRSVIGHLTHTLLFHAPAAIAEPDRPEPVHQMRVAMRRARSAISVFRAALGGPAVDAANDGLRALGRTLGAARDWDVFATETLPPVLAAFPDEPRLARLSRAVARRRKAHRAELAGWLDGAAFRGLCIRLACLAARDAWQDTAAPPLPAFAATVLRKRWKRVLSAGEVLDGESVTAMHGLRLHAKRARYAAEIFAPLFAERPAARFIRRLSRLQHELGLLNDRAVAAGLLAELGGATGRHAFACGVVLGFCAAAEHRKTALETWKKVRRTDPFWT
jgi:triphosphatase